MSDEGCDFVEGGVELAPDHPEEISDDDSFTSCSSPKVPGEHVAEQFWSSREGKKALFLDYDGTLREFEKVPADAVPSDELREILEAINQREDLEGHVISGRDAGFLELHFRRYDKFTLIAEHGHQIWRVGAPRWEVWDASVGLHANWKDRMRSVIERMVEETPGSHCEEKSSSLVWHYRCVADEAFAETQVTRAIKQLEIRRLEEHLHQVTITKGHKIVELAHQQVRKGLVMRKLCEEQGLFGKPFASVLCAGDDVSDESMFEAAPSDFITIKVGQGRTKAAYRVDNPAQLRAWLKQIVDL